MEFAEAVWSPDTARPDFLEHVTPERLWTSLARWWMVRNVGPAVRAAAGEATQLRRSHPLDGASKAGCILPGAGRRGAEASVGCWRRSKGCGVDDGALALLVHASSLPKQRTD